MKQVLITGAGGFVGRHLIHVLQARGDTEIFAAVYQATSDVLDLIPADHVIAGDLTDFAFATKLVQTARPKLVYHLAALSVVHLSAEQTTTVINTNTTISYNVLEALRLHAPSARIVTIGSGNIYGAVQDTSRPISESNPLRPLNSYAVSKITQEMLALQYHLAYEMDVVMLRPFNHTGVGQTNNFVIPRLAEQFVSIEKGGSPEVKVGNLETVRDFTDVRDMAKAYLLAADKCQSGEVYNIGTGLGHSIREILDIFQSLSPVKVDIKKEESRVRASDVPILVADSAKFRQATGWEPTITLTQTISAILDYWRTK